MPFRELRTRVKPKRVVETVLGGHNRLSFDERRLARGQAPDMSSLNFRCIIGI
jgi:hypothetical protein